MALNFPDAPGIGSVYTDANSGFSWQWSGVVWKNYKQSTLSTINIVDDTTPQLGGDLDLNSKDVGGTGDFNISGIVTATSFVGDGSGLTGVANTGFVNAEQVTVVGVVTASSFVKSGGTSSQFLKADGSVDTSTYLTDISQDTTPQLGGNLDLNSSNITGTGDISVTGDLTLTDTDAGSSAGPEFKLYRNSSSPADADYLGQIKFAGESDTGVERNYAKITGKILDASNGTEDGIIEFAHIKAGSQNISGRWRSDSLQLLNGTNLTVAGDATVTGEISATAGFNIGISSGGTTITNGPITALNFVGTGNTFAVNGTTVDISISGGGGASVSIGTEAPTSPSAGDLWYNNEKARTFIYYDEADAGTGSAAFWVDSSPFVLPATDPDPVAAKTSATFTAEANQNGFPFEHTVGFIDVYLNGIRLSPSEFTSDGATVTLGAAASAGDVVDLVQYRMGIGATGPQGPAGGKWGTFSTNTGITTTVKVQIQNNLEVTGVTTSTGGFVGALTGDVTGNINASGGGSTFNSNVGVQTNNITRSDLVGAGNSFVGLYIGDGFLAFSTSLNRPDGYYISTSINALNAGPVTLGSTMTLDGTWVIV